MRFLPSISQYTLAGLPEWSAAPKGQLVDQLGAIADAGYQHMELTEPGNAGACRAAGLSYSRGIRINAAEEAAPLISAAADEGCMFVSVHLGWGMETDAEAHDLIEATLSASKRYHLPAYVELHRATILQDARRTVDFVQAFPELELTADFSHWYVGHEMVYGGFETKCAFIQPIFSRVRHVHGRIADPGCMQITVRDPDATYVAHFKELWRQCFLAAPSTLETFPFTIELLESRIYYARCQKTAYGWEEESDRWLEGLKILQIARDCFEQTQSVP